MEPLIERCANEGSPVRDRPRLGRKTLRIKVQSVERFIDATPVGNWR
jgi:hypothetical protein